jgi:putative ATPase
MDLFTHAAAEDHSREPLAERMRPQTLAEFVGQEHLTGEGKFLRKAISSDQIPSLILWGPPGTGKTTLGRVIARATGAEFVALSAVLAGVKDLREAVSSAEERWAQQRKRTLLFVDEIHRFNKSQQDALLPHVERGTLTLIGATTENPSFEVNAALLSRCRVVTLKALEEEELLLLLKRALEDPRGYGGTVTATDEALVLLAQSAGGDGRRALNALEAAAAHGQGRIDKASAQEAIQKRTLLYDKSGEEHYNVVSAFIKSMRGSDPDASVYWMARMLEAGEDPLFILRRMVIFASEDIGNADPQALAVAVSALAAFELVGLPEGTLPLTQAVTYLAMAPKANTVLTTYAKARAAAVEGALPVPLHLRNAPTPLMKKMGYGGGYKYPHNFEGNYVPESYLPDKLSGQSFYAPGQSGFEKELSERLQKQRTQASPRKPPKEGEE